MKRPDCRQYETFWAKAQALINEQPQFPYDSVEMKAGPLDGGGSWHGLKRKATGKCYGVVRQIGRANELISESTFLDNKLHGLVL